MPFITTFMLVEASPSAIARPMPLLEPVTIAVFLSVIEVPLLSLLL
jgi:hypothetical protein